MAILKSKRLAVVVKLAALREQEQLLRMQKSQNNRLQQQQSMQRLQSFQSDYAEHGTTVAKTPLDDAGNDAVKASVSITELQNFSRFMDDLSYAIELQERQVEQADNQWQQENAQWSQLHAKQQALEELVERARGEEDQLFQTQMDREVDDSWNSLRGRGKSRVVK